MEKKKKHQQEVRREEKNWNFRLSGRGSTDGMGNGCTEAHCRESVFAKQTSGRESEAFIQEKKASIQDVKQRSGGKREESADRKKRSGKTRRNDALSRGGGKWGSGFRTDLPAKSHKTPPRREKKTKRRSEDNN